MTTTLLPSRSETSSKSPISPAQKWDRQRPPYAPNLGDASFDGNFVIVDGSNLLWLDNEQPRLTTLLSALTEIARRASDFLVLFDAPTWYDLKGYSPAEAAAYRQLVRDYCWYFVETNGGTQADPLILAEARDRQATVISRDRFNQYREQHPWLGLPGRLIPVHQVREGLRIGLHGCPLRGDLDGLMKEVKKHLQERSVERLTLSIVSALESGGKDL